MSADADDLPPRLRCEGGQLIKPNGEPIFLHGVSFGAWGKDQPLDAEAVKALGANCVRIALRWRGKYGTESNDAWDEQGFAYLKRWHVQHWLDMIVSASNAGLWVIPFIDSNCGQSGTQDPEQQAYCDPYMMWGARGRNFYTDPGFRKTFTQIVWPTAARLLRGIPKIAMLELHPEPAGERGPEYTPYVAQVQREAIAAIREVDADTPFLIGARNAYDIDLVAESLLPERADCVYTGNLLNQFVVNPERFDQGLSTLTRLREEHGVPIHCQQIGRKSGADPGLHYMRRAVQRMREENVGYAWWQWKQNTDNPDDYALNYKTPDGNGWIAKEDEMTILEDDWKGGAS